MHNGAVTDLHAAIDIGTNSTHLVVARTSAAGGLEVLTTLKEPTRLGADSDDMRELAPDAIDRGIVALERMVSTAKSMGAEVIAVATSAVREARNRDEFLRRARREIGVEIDVISGSEEARLIHVGVLSALPVFDTRMMLVDIGGGSTEFLVGEGFDVVEARSMKLGSIRLTNRFFGDGVDKPTKSQLAGCRRSIRNALIPVVLELGGHQPQTFVGSSGTILNVAEMCVRMRDDKVQSLNGATFTRSELDAAIEAVVSRTADKRIDLPGLDPKRGDIILGGIMLLEAIFDEFMIDEMVVSENALREGVLIDRFGNPADRRHLREPRRANVERLSRELDPDPAHAAHTAHLAVELFDRTTRLHELGADERELLESAALLHNVGLFISHSSHHKHSYYVIRNSDRLTGFTDREIEIIALTARYHRKSLPQKKHFGYCDLDTDDQQLVQTLAGVLRIAIGLDRRHAGAVETVRVHRRPDGVEIEPVPTDGADVEMERFAAADRAELLSVALDQPVDVIAPVLITDSPHFSS